MPCERERGNSVCVREYERERDRERERERDRDRQRERQRETDRDRERHNLLTGAYLPSNITVQEGPNSPSKKSILKPLSFV